MFIVRERPLIKAKTAKIYKRTDGKNVYSQSDNISMIKVQSK